MDREFLVNVNDLFKQARQLERGPTQVALLEEAVRLADCHQDRQLGYQARIYLMEAATFGGEMDKAMVAFSWCLALADREPEQFPV